MTRRLTTLLPNPSDIDSLYSERAELLHQYRLDKKSFGKKKTDRVKEIDKQIEALEKLAA